MEENIIETIIGKDDADKLSAAFGGQMLYVPKTNNQNLERIVGLIGVAQANTFQWYFQGGSVYVRQTSLDYRNQAIRRARADMTVRDVAALFRMSMTHVARICSAV